MVRIPKTTLKKASPSSAKQLALACAKLALDKKAFNVMVLDVRPWNGINDYIVICSAQSSVQAQTIADHIQKTLKEKKIRCTIQEGYSLAKWILLDYNDVVVHIFDEYVRDYYAIEHLWHDAPRVKIRHGSKRK